MPTDPGKSYKTKRSPSQGHIPEGHLSQGHSVEADGSKQGPMSRREKRRSLSWSAYTYNLAVAAQVRLPVMLRCFTRSGQKAKEFIDLRPNNET